MQGDGVHSSCPNQQRICGIRGALVTVTTAFDDESQIVLAGEIDGRHDVVGRLGGHSIGTWPGSPGIHPAEGLRQPDLIAEKIRVLQFLEQLRAVGADGASRHAASGDCTLTSRPPTSRPSRSQLASDGHAGSPGRAREMEPDRPRSPVGASIHNHVARKNESAAAAARKKPLLFISILPKPFLRDGRVRNDGSRSLLGSFERVANVLAHCPCHYFVRSCLVLFLNIQPPRKAELGLARRCDPFRRHAWRARWRGHLRRAARR